MRNSPPQLPHLQHRPHNGRGAGWRPRPQDQHHLPSLPLEAGQPPGAARDLQRGEGGVRDLQDPSTPAEDYCHVHGAEQEEVKLSTESFLQFPNLCFPGCSPSHFVLSPRCLAELSFFLARYHYPTFWLLQVGLSFFWYFLFIVCLFFFFCVEFNSSQVS